MTFVIVFSERAEEEIDDIFFWMLGHSPNSADTWLRGLHETIDALREIPTRCTIARENILFDTAVRQILHGKYRILFSLIDADGDERFDTVRILHVRRGAR